MTRDATIDALKGSLSLWQSILKMHQKGRTENRDRALNNIAEIKAKIKELGGDV